MSNKNYEYKKKRIILFGAGVYAKKYKALLEYLHMDFDYFTDNDSSKWGTVLYGKPIIPPDELTDFLPCQIIISSTHEIAIRKQLSEIGLSDCIIGLDDLYNLCEHKMNGLTDDNVTVHQEDIIIVDMYEGIGWGGTELWAANLANGLMQSGKKSIILGGTEQPELENQYEELIIRISEQDTITHMVNMMEQNLPFTFINNFAGCAFMAAIILKKKYPHWVNIISVIHNDNKSLFDAHMMLKEYVDKIFCVSSQICDHMRALYDYDVDKYFFREQPVYSNKILDKNWNTSVKLRIGYAARLVKQQKRADLLVNLISEFEKRNIDYLFQIAGDGEYLSVISDFVKNAQLEGKVELLGRLSKYKMNDFWRNQDVFVNISEYEGTSLSMLEAMSFGCVPVVTDVSGAKEFIDVGKNGYICAVGDLDGIADGVKQLNDDRDRLIRYGKECHARIVEKCNPEKYIEYWMEKVL